jgi:NADH-quinone oxidoreductase subunit L
MTRVMFMTFAGERRWDPDADPHEVPPIMTSPMILLAVGAVGWGAFEILGDRLAHFLGPVTGYVPPEPAIFSPAGIAALVLALAAVALAWAMYGRRPVPSVAPAAGFAVTAARRDLYGDAFNESVLMRPGQWLTRLSVYFDNRGVDGLVNTIAAAVGGTSGRMRRLQTGFVRSYALSMFVGAVLLVGAFLLVRV